MRYHLNYFTALESTNDWLMKRHELRHEIENQVVVAGFQTNGKGQQGSGWQSEQGKNLLFSVGLRTDFLHPASQFLLSKAIALALIDSVEKLTERKGVKIKWPNDIYVDGKKVCGILILNLLNGNKLAFSIVGVGLNVNQLCFPENLPNPISLRAITQRDFDLKEVLALVLKNIAHQVDLISQENEQEHVHEKYFNNLYQLDELHPYLIHGQRIIAKITAINEFGQLMLEDRSGKVYTCDVKELVYL